MSVTPASKRCFLITPIGNPGSVERKRADWVFRFIEEVCRELGFQAERADLMPGSPMITARIFGAVTEADICIADLTGLNANVFYELGVRHTVSKPVVHIAESGTVLPFDNAQHDAHFYDLSDINSIDQLKRSLLLNIKEMTSDGYVVSNPLTAALGTIDVGRSADTKDQVIAGLNERLERLESTTYRKNAAPSLGPMGHDEAVRILENFVDSAQKTEASFWVFNESVFARAVALLDPWDEKIAFRVYDATYGPKAPNNGAELRKYLYAEFPALIERVPGLSS